MNYAQHREEMLRHYCALVTNPHWRQYVQHQVREMARECPAIYHGFPEAVDAALAAHRKAGAISSASTSPKTTAA